MSELDFERTHVVRKPTGSRRLLPLASVGGGEIFLSTRDMKLHESRTDVVAKADTLSADERAKFDLGILTRFAPERLQDEDVSAAALNTVHSLQMGSLQEANSFLDLLETAEVTHG